MLLARLILYRQQLERGNLGLRRRQRACRQVQRKAVALMLAACTPTSSTTSGAASANPIFERGFKYVFATLNNMWLWLARNPDRVEEIRNRPDDIMDIVEELLRRFSVTYSARVVVKATVLNGIEMKKNDRVFVCLPAANFDPQVFPDPLKVDFDRPRKTILAFTVGVHSCMGGHLARMEIKVLLEELVPRSGRPWELLRKHDRSADDGDD